MCDRTANQRGARRTLLRLGGAFGLASLLSYSGVFAQEPAGTAPARATDGRGSFIAAFEWPVESSVEFVRPFEAMRAAPYDTVWLVVEKMPVGWVEKRGRRVSTLLTAAWHLRINGRLLRPRRRIRLAGGGDGDTPVEEFSAALEQGRLRLSLSVPPGFKLDPRRASVKIRLYQARSRTSSGIYALEARLLPGGLLYFSEGDSRHGGGRLLQRLIRRLPRATAASAVLNTQWPFPVSSGGEGPRSPRGSRGPEGCRGPGGASR